MDHRAEAWYRRRTSHWRDWPLGQLLEDKQRRGARISVVIPARNEERTVAGIVCSHAGGQRPRTRPFRVAYDDVDRDVLAGTLGLAARALEAGVAPDRRRKCSTATTRSASHTW